MTDREAINAFLATRGATQVAPGLAYGVDKEADKAKRAAERDRKAYDAWERDHERRMELAHDAFFVGDTEEGYAQMTGFRRIGRGRYERA